MAGPTKADLLARITELEDENTRLADAGLAVHDENVDLLEELAEALANACQCNIPGVKAEITGEDALVTGHGEVDIDLLHPTETPAKPHPSEKWPIRKGLADRGDDFNPKK